MFPPPSSLHSHSQKAADDDAYWRSRLPPPLPPSDVLPPSLRSLASHVIMDVASIAVFVQAFSRQLLLVPPPPFPLLLLSICHPHSSAGHSSVPLAYEETFTQLLSFVCVRAFPSPSAPSESLERDAEKLKTSSTFHDLPCVHWQLLDCMTAPYFYTLIVTSLPAFTFHSLAADMSAALHSPNGIWTSPPAIKVALLQVLINHICDCEWLTSQFEPLPDVPLPNVPSSSSFESQALGCLAAPVVSCVPLPRKPETYRHELLPHSRIVPVTTDVWNRSIWAIQGHLIISDCSGGVCRMYWTPSSIQLALRALACGGGGEGSSSCDAELSKSMLPMRTSHTQALQWLLTWSRGVQQQHASSFESPKLFAWRNLHVDIRSLAPALPPRFFNFTMVPLPLQIIASARAAPLSEEHGAAAPQWRMLPAPTFQRNHGPQLDGLLPSPVAVPALALRAHSRVFAQVQLLLL
jgi:hypothetical protein